ncbi:unnamed protein product [Ostreobium quekettii]|uniref:HpcH/HpaI aldolase/citrate lyase domain-containing protein n=1 Tax=Ostreobium quekettii TaxID=121088 RepID=A0A8S1JBH7_9CHLO|nr:unnamed protein product [Ostreobium quekettii]|eukprot:evm.model.scf_674.2 EVM.evm.TU.scf_674.2   scf_674:8078-8947(+)
MLSCIRRGGQCVAAGRSLLRPAASHASAGPPAANRVKAKLLAGEPARGLWGMLPSPEAARLLARIPGLDWVVIDMEHGPIDLHSMHRITASLIDRPGGPVPIVRVPIGTAPHVKRAFDAGAMGVVVPMVNDASQARDAVQACKLPPAGVRSFGSPWAPLGLGDGDTVEHVKSVNDSTLVIVQIESAEAMRNLDEILSVEGIDVALVGPIDLSISLGLEEPSPDGGDPRLVKALEEVLEAGERHGVACGIYCKDGVNAAERIRQGFRFVNVANDALGLVAHVQEQLEAAR